MKVWDASGLEMKMMAARFALCVHVARAATWSPKRVLGHGLARSLSSDTGLLESISLCVSVPDQDITGEETDLNAQRSLQGEGLGQG